jgi:alcohol dehydrogenase
MPETSQAAVFHAPAERLTFERFPLPNLTGSEALVCIRCATICGSDLHSITGRRPAPAPSILGHEMVGELIAAGPLGARDFNGQPLAPGTRVTWSMVWSCAECPFCLRGLPQKCERLMKFGHERITPGRALIGGMAEYCWLPERTAIFRIPDNVPDLVASPANCATATVAAIFRAAGPVENQTVVIHGAGMLGQTACAMAATQSASRILVIDPDPLRRHSAIRFGASVALEPDQATPDIQADLGIELAGFPESFELGLSLLRPGGRFIAAGATFPARPVSFSAEQIVRRLLRIEGVYNYAPQDLATALQFLSANIGRYPFESLIGAVYPLSEVNSAIEFALANRPPRVALIP